MAIGSLSQLVSQQSPVMLLAVQENHNADGHYGFTCRHREGGGLVVETVDNSHLCVGDRYDIQIFFFFFPQKSCLPMVTAVMKCYDLWLEFIKGHLVSETVVYNVLLIPSFFLITSRVPMFCSRGGQLEFSPRANKCCHS